MTIIIKSELYTWMCILRDVDDDDELKIMRIAESAYIYQLKNCH
jgi:hypothetical protein